MKNVIQDGTENGDKQKKVRSGVHLHQTFKKFAHKKGNNEQDQ